MASHTPKPMPAPRQKSLKKLKSLLQIPLLTRHQVSGSRYISSTLGSVPVDLVLEIAELLSPSDVLNFSLTSSGLRSLLLPNLYSTVTLRSSRQCRLALDMLEEHPEITRHVKKLAVRPNYYLAWPKPDEFLSESWVAMKIEKISSHLVSLHTFDWDGLEMPDDHLWLTLRNSCPLLRTVYCNVGSRTIDPNSYLFDFNDLISFSLIVRNGLSGSALFPPLEELPDRFWDMILERCPNLEEITVLSFSSNSRLLDFNRIASGRWPKLSMLTVGPYGYRSDFSIGPTINGEFSDFLAAHPSIKNLRLSWSFKYWVSPETMSMGLPPSALPLLDTFNGIYQQLGELPNPSSIETVDLTSEAISENRIPLICPILRNLTSLTSLDIWMHVPNTNGDHSYFFSSILRACPLLTDFHFMCTTPFTAKPLQELSTALSELESLKVFCLTKGHKYRDESMIQSAMRIIKDNQNLEQINIRWARETCPNHLKQEGTYDVIKGDDGTPIRFLVFERGLRLVGQPFFRRYTHELKLGGRWENKRLSRLLS